MNNNVIRKGLIMEGGAMRGMFTCGVIDVMQENGITFDGAVGVSAGATFGINIKSHQIGRAIRYNKKYIKDKRYCSLRNLIFTGDLFNRWFCYKTLPFALDLFDTDTFTSDSMEFYVVATNVCTGGPEYHLCTTGKDSDLEWIRASASIPMLSNIVEVDGYKLLDGGISDSIPVRFMEDKGYNKNVAILTRPIEYVKKPSFGLASKLLLKDYPEMIAAMANRPTMYNGETAYIRERENEGELFVIRPPKDLKMPNMTRNVDELQEMYDCGRKIMSERLEELKAYLSL